MGRNHGTLVCQKSKNYATPTKEKTVKGIRSSDKRPAALINIERKIENDGSATGGWTARDHALFLRMLQYQLRSVVNWLVEKSKEEGKIYLCSLAGLKAE